jgi:anti-sigma-K factor RskA
MSDDDRDALAAEYVLGTLSADERDQAEVLLTIDSGFAEVVRHWERRLGELNVMVEAVEPPPAVWEKIWAEIGGAPRGDTFHSALFEDTAPMPEFKAENEEPTSTEAEMASPMAALASSLVPEESGSDAAVEVKSPTQVWAAPSLPPATPKIERSADVVYLAARVRRWRGISVVVGAVAALLALYVGLSRFAPGVLPPGWTSGSTVVAQGPAKPQGSRLIGALQQEPISPAFLVTVDSESRTLTVRRISAAADAGHSYELWLISKRFPNPRSLGIVGAEEFTQRPIPINFDTDTLRAATYAVSLEPAGGSPVGVPTGPILFTGKLVESIPGTQPPG